MATSSPFPPETVFEIAPRFEFEWETGQQCYVLRYPEGLVTLNESAAEILKRLDGRTTVDEITQELDKQYEGAMIRPDVHEFLQVAQEHGWVQLKDAEEEPKTAESG